MKPFTHKQLIEKALISDSEYETGRFGSPRVFAVTYLSFYQFTQGLQPEILTGSQQQRCNFS